MEDVSTVFVNLNALYFFCVDISADMAAFFKHQNTFSGGDGPFCEHRAE